MAVRGNSNPPIHGSVAIASNPTSGTVMADSGAVANPGVYEARFVLSASVAAAFSIQHRNAANDANISPSPMTVYAAGAQSSQYALMFKLAASERVRVTMAANLTGQAQCWVQLEAMI